MQEKDIYDIIIENCTKEWKKSMTIIKLTWEQPKYSKKKIERAGKVLIKSNSTQDEIDEALRILNNWRSSHAYPLHVITNNLKRKNPKAIVVQRLKRLDSIIAKLNRFPEMSLYKMQDLGGCRVIVDSIKEVYSSVARFKNSHVRHIFKKENDYIQNPKESGYRSYHMVYQYQSDDNDTYNKNMLIEIQFRTKLQHIWATAVEVMGVYTKSHLKSSIGDKDILRFFVLASSVFAIMEDTPICPNVFNNRFEIIKEMKEIDNKINIVSKLSAISVAINHTNTNKNMKGKGYYLLRLNLQERQLKINGFNTNEITLATNVYNDIEAKNNPKIDTVLVSATSFDDLKAAYPNYFTDISTFVNMMRRLLK